MTVRFIAPPHGRTHELHIWKFFKSGVSLAAGCELSNAGLFK
jgi:hypothetical protein